MSAHGSTAPTNNSETGATQSTSFSAGSVTRSSEPTTLAEMAAADAARLRRKQSEKKRQWRQTRTEQQRRQMRERDAERKRAVRDKMTPEQRRIEREKDATRKALKRQLEKEKRRSSAAMSINRILNQ